MCIQSELTAKINCETDYELTESQDFKKVYQYALNDSTSGKCAVEFIWQDISGFLSSLFGIVIYGSLLSTLNPFLLIVIAIVSASSYFTTRLQPKYYEKHKDKFEKEVRKLSYLNRISEDLYIAKDIKLYSMEGFINKLINDYKSFILMWDKKCNLQGFLASVISGLMSMVQNSATYFVLIGLLVAKVISVGDFVFYFSAVASISKFMQTIIINTSNLINKSEKINYYRDFYSYKNKFKYDKGIDLPKGQIKVEIKNLWYKYDGAEDYTLKNINLTIEKGESIALVGLNGAGKTTLIKLICGFYMPTKGEILINGVNVKDFNIKEYYSLISAVFQDINPVAFSMFEFVASSDLNRKNARDEAIEAMKKSGIYDKICTLRKGIDTHLMKGIYDDGVDFSGGEMQKLLLARAIYKNSPILILDEPTSALDPIAESNLYNEYKKLNKNKTSIFISHRLASTNFCDRIVFLDKGEIIESGTHRELINKKGKYAYLYSVQSKYYKEGDINE